MLHIAGRGVEIDDTADRAALRAGPRLGRRQNPFGGGDQRRSDVRGSILSKLRFGDHLTYRMAMINGEPGLLRYIDGKVESATCCVTDGERIVGIYSVRNPDKLAHIPPLQ